jgi:hypothetical protein
VSLPSVGICLRRQGRCQAQTECGDEEEAKHANPPGGRLLLHLFRLLPFLFGGHRRLALENLALCQQLDVYTRTLARPSTRNRMPHDPLSVAL